MSLHVGSRTWARLLVLLPLWLSAVPASAGLVAGRSVRPQSLVGPPITIGDSTTFPIVDGSCFSSLPSSAVEYGDATRVAFQTQGGTRAYAYAKHTATDLYICMYDLVVPLPAMRDGPNAVVYIDRLGTGGAFPASDHLALSISYDGTVRANRGSGSGYNGPDPRGYAVERRVGGELPVWSAEFRISSATLGGASWSRQIGIAVAQQWVRESGDDYGWPSGYSWIVPDTWNQAELSGSPAPADVDLLVTGLEVTQGIQDLANSVPLLTGKRTFVRVHVRATEARNAVGARLYGFRAGASLGAPLLPANPGSVITVYRSPNRAVLSDSFLFELPSSWTAPGTIGLRADINPLRNPAESNYANNSQADNFSFQVTRPLRMRLRDIQYTHRNGTLISSRDLDQDLLESQLRRMFPISQLISDRRWMRVLTPENPLRNEIGTAAGYVVGLLQRARSIDSGDPGRLHFGMVSDTGGFMRGWTPWMPAWETASPTGMPCGSWCWDTDASYGDWYGAHEIGHALGRPHVGRVLGGEIGCGADWWLTQEAYPYDRGIIGGQGFEQARFFGFDAGDAGLRVPSAVIPNTWTDVMSYCPNEWISDWNYGRIRDYVDASFAPTTARAAERAASPQAARAAAAATSGDFLALFGTLDTGRQTVSLPLVSREAEIFERPPLVPGQYAIRLLDGAGRQLASYAFTPLVNPDTPELATIRQVVDWAPGTRRIAIVSNAAGREIGSLDASANAPAVAAVAHSGGVNVPAAGPITVSWNGGDADGDSVTYDLKYSFDNRAGWRTLASGIAGTSITIDAGELEGTSGALAGYLRVVARDGLLTGHADSPGFTVAGKAPVARIANPGDASAYGYGQSVTLEGVAQDFEDGTLDGAAISWSSDRDGSLGTGRVINPALLSVGTHTIRLQATDSHGQTGSATVSVVIREDAALLQPSAPLLEVAPAAGVFIGRAGGPNPELQTISIRDLSGAATEWTADSDAGWINLGAERGTAPAELTISVDTAGMRAGTSRTGRVYIRAPGAANSPRAVNVTVQLEGDPPTLVFVPSAVR